MAVENVSIKFNINNNVLNTTINNLKRAGQETQKLQNRVNSLRNSLRSLGNTRIRINGLNDITNQVNRSTSGMSKAQKAALKLYQELHNVGKINLNEIPEEFREIVQAETRSQTETAKLYMEMAKLGRINLNDIPADLRRILNASQDTREEFQRMENELRDITNQSNNAQREMRQLSNISMSNLSNNLMSIGNNLMNAGRTMTQYVTKPILAGFGFSVKSAMDFEQQLDFTGAKANATGKEMEKLKDQAVKLGIATKYSALDVAKGQEEMIKAGRNIKQVFNEMDDVLNLAAAGNIEVARAAEIGSNMMNMFSDQGLKMSKIADLMAGAANKSAINIEDFYLSMQYVGGKAASLKIPLKDLAAVIAVAGNNANKSGKAGRGLNQFLSHLQPASEKAGDMMKRLGIITEDGANNFFDAQGKLKSFADIIDVVRGSVNGLTDAQKEEALRVMFGQIASPTMYALIKKNSSAINEMGNEIEDITAADVAARQMNNFAGTVEKVKSTIESIAIKIGDMFIPILNALAKMVNKVLGVIAELPTPLLAIGIAIAFLVAGIGPLTMAFAFLIITIGAVVGAISAIGSAVAAVGLPVIAAFTGAFVAITTLVGGLATLVITSEDVRSGIGKAFNNMANEIKKAATWTKQHVGDIKDALSGLIEFIKTGNFDQNFDKLKNSLLNMFPNHSSDISGFLIKLSDFRNTVIKVRDTILDFKDKIVAILTPVISMFAKTFSSFDFSAIVTSFNTMKTSLAPVIDLLKGLAMIIGGIVAVQIGIFLGIWNGIISAIDNVIAVILNLVGIIGNAFGLIIGIVTMDGDLMKQSFINLWENIKGIFVNGVMAIIDFVVGLVTGIITWFTTLYNVLVGHSIVPDMINAIVNWFQGLPNRVLAFIISLVNSAVNTFNNFKNGVSNIFNGIKNAISSAMNSAKNIVSSAMSTIKSLLSGFTFPKIKLPHFSIKGKFDLAKLSVPKLGISWYAKGGIFNSPSVIGVGESGQEAVLPISRLDELMAKALTKSMDIRLKNYNNGGNGNYNNSTSNNSKVINISYSGNVGTDDKNRLTNMLRMAGVY